ncbi:MAG: 50S ribosomal protein L13 [Deltaproteobacteria bacterium RIFOXYA12_FULL_58_15]|nr:MAG: 50S ribosomal protein L13 [Deltaproteobacteria bacterium RIFOXYA12_FULL_58_15]OGR13647.1 MAG: 50S ribosomal protein L13 [Deltaproteobacteria bacterium RIFOXYB12_FULL_58_9]
MITKSAKAEEVIRRWFVLDGKEQVLGRVSTRIASVLRGKHKPEFTPHVDTGDFVIVINADKIKLTGRKETDKMYHYHTGWIGHIVSRSAQKLREEKPELIIERAVRGMLPKGPLGHQMLSKLKIYAGSEHPHAAQKPEVLSL